MKTLNQFFPLADFTESDLEGNAENSIHFARLIGTERSKDLKESFGIQVKKIGLRNLDLNNPVVISKLEEFIAAEHTAFIKQRFILSKQKTDGWNEFNFSVSELIKFWSADSSWTLESVVFEFTNSGLDEVLESLIKAKNPGKELTDSQLQEIIGIYCSNIFQLISKGKGKGKNSLQSIWIERISDLVLKESDSVEIESILIIAIRTALEVKENSDDLISANLGLVL